MTPESSSPALFIEIISLLFSRGEENICFNSEGHERISHFHVPPSFPQWWVVENVFSPAAGHRPQNRHSSVDFEPPSAEQLKQNSLVLFLCRTQPLCVLCKSLVVVCGSTGSECVFCSEPVWMRLCVFRRERAVCGWYAGRVLGYGVLIAGCFTAAF